MQWITQHVSPHKYCFGIFVNTRDIHELNDLRIQINDTRIDSRLLLESISKNEFTDKDTQAINEIMTKIQHLFNISKLIKNHCIHQQCILPKCCGTCRKGIRKSLYRLWTKAIFTRRLILREVSLVIDKKWKLVDENESDSIFMETRKEALTAIFQTPFEIQKIQ